MKKCLILFVLMVLLAGCQMTLEVTGVTATTQAIESSLAEGKPDWSVYDPDPEQPWNRVFHQLYGRTATDGKEYGADELDPLLWLDTTHLLTGVSHQKALQVLEDFLAAQADHLIQDPLKRAMFQ